MGQGQATLEESQQIGGILIYHEGKGHWGWGRELIFIEHSLWARNRVVCFIYFVSFLSSWQLNKIIITVSILKMGKLTFRDMSRSQTAKGKSSVKIQVRLIPGLFTIGSQNIRETEQQRHKRMRGQRDTESDKDKSGIQRNHECIRLISSISDKTQNCTVPSCPPKMATVCEPCPLPPPFWMYGTLWGPT